MRYAPRRSANAPYQVLTRFIPGADDGVEDAANPLAIAINPTSVDRTTLA